MSIDKRLLSKEISNYRSMTYVDLEKLIQEGNNLTTLVVEEAGKEYQVDISIEWEDKKARSIRVIGFIDESQPKRWWRQFISGKPEGFIIYPDGKVTT